MRKNRYIFVAFILTLVLSACHKQEVHDSGSPDKDNNGLDFSINKKENAVKGEGQKAQKEAGKDPKNAGYAFKLNGAHIFDLKDTIEIDGIAFKDLKVEIQKGLKEGVKKSDVTYFDEPTDDAGTLGDGYTYIFADITIKNTTNKPQTVYLSGGNFVVVNGKNEIVDTTSELRYRSGYVQTGATKRDYNRCDFKPGEEKHLQLGYIAQDSLVNQSNLLYSINLHGTGSGGDDFKAFKVR